MSILRRLALTITYISCFPLSHASEEEGETALLGLAKFLPAAGIFIGCALAAAAALLAFLSAPGLVKAAFLTVLWFIFTSGLHLDGLMDTSDGICSHKSPARVLEIMQDSRVGNFGVLVGVSTLLLKCACLSALKAPDVIAVLPLITGWARWSEAYAIGHFPYLRESGKGKIWHDSMQYPRDLYLAAALPLLYTLILAATGRFALIAVALAAVGIGIITANWLAGKLAGHTGDTYGCVVEVAETGALIVAAMVLGSTP